jgi:hypothetical protein
LIFWIELALSLEMIVPATGMPQKEAKRLLNCNDIV